MLAKKIIQDDFQKMYEYLTDYDYKSIISAEELKQELKHIHKASYILYLWKVELNKNGIESLHLDEIISTLIEVVYISIYKDNKALYMLYRNIIDNFTKIVREYHGIEDNLYTLQILEGVSDLEVVKQHLILKDSFQRILGLYKISCGYVHSTQERFLSLNHSVRNYGKVDGDGFKKCIQDFCNLVKNINYILILYYREVYENFNVDEKRLVNYFCNKKELRKIFISLYDVSY